MDGQPRGDEDLAQRMLQGDDEAFREVYRAVHPGLLRYLSVLVGPGDAEDVAAETWAQAVRDLGRFSGGLDGFRGWVTSIARHRALDLLRAQSRRPVADRPVEEFEHVEPRDTEGEALSLVTTADALHLISSLPPDQAEAVLLRVVVGLDARTAGEVLGKRAGAVRTAAYRGLKALEKKLAEEDRGEV